MKTESKAQLKQPFIMIAVIVVLLTAGIGAAVLMIHMKPDQKSDLTKITDFHNELLGENVYLFTPEDDPVAIQAVLDELWEEQEDNQFGTSRYAVYFMPGVYDEELEVKLGFYMQVAGLGVLPTDTVIPSLQCTARWLEPGSANHNACCNFWRGVENIELGSNTMFAVSQATFMRRVQVDGALFLHDENGWCSGGFLADSNIELMTDSGSQQQWLSRNCNWKMWMGSNWNMVFMGLADGAAPRGQWPGVPYTKIEETETVREKPFLICEDGKYSVFVPDLRQNMTGVSWQAESETGTEYGTTIPIEDFYVAKEGEATAQSINDALAKGKHLFFTPGIYELDEPIIVENPDTIILGTGLASLVPTQGNECMIVREPSGVILAGLLFDAGPVESENLLVVEEGNARQEELVGQDELVGQEDDTEQTPACLSDMIFRVGGAATYAAKVQACVTIHADNVIGDQFWVWRADHGEQVAWDLNTAKNGLIVNGDNVTIYALMVEHFQEYQTIWNGNNGRIIMYQSEIPYDVPSQDVWMSRAGTREGYASIFVADDVEQFEAWGLGIYLYNRDAAVNLESAVEMPDREGVKIHNICTVLLTGYPGMNHIINEAGAAVLNPGERQLICEYENGILK